MIGTTGLKKNSNLSTGQSETKRNRLIFQFIISYSLNSLFTYITKVLRTVSCACAAMNSTDLTSFVTIMPDKKNV